MPTAPGGTADALARLYAQHLSKVLGQQFYVENRGGAGNVLGIDSVVRSPADGYTLLLGAGTITINHLVYKKLPYDVLRDLTPVTQMISVPNVLVVHPSQPMKTLADYVAAAKAAPGKINYGSAGVGSNLHLAMELLKYRTGIEVTHVPYKGVGPALQDTLAGHVMSMIVERRRRRSRISTRARSARSPSRRCKRSPALPDVPTMSEAGVKDYEVLNWFGVFAPAGTPQPIVDRLAAEAAAMFADPKTKRDAHRRRRRPDRQQARRLRRLRARRDQEMGRGRQGRQHPADGVDYSVLLAVGGARNLRHRNAVLDRLAADLLGPRLLLAQLQHRHDVVARDEADAGVVGHHQVARRRPARRRS